MTQTESARELRQRMTLAEGRLWRLLRGRRVGGMKFRRQEPLGPFVVDFLCEEQLLVVELDGSVHDEQTEQDAYRTTVIASFGYRVIRFWNTEVLTDPQSVVKRILANAHPSNNPSP